MKFMCVKGSNNSCPNSTILYSNYQFVFIETISDKYQYDLHSIYNWAVHNMFLTLKSSITFHLVHLCLLIVIMYMPIQIWKS